MHHVCSRLAREGTVIPGLDYYGMSTETLSRLLCHLQQFWVFFRSSLHKYNSKGWDFLSKDSSYLAMGSVKLKDTNITEGKRLIITMLLVCSSHCRKTRVFKAPNAWHCGEDSSSAGTFVSATPTHRPDILQPASHSYSCARVSNCFMQGTSELKASKEPFHAWLHFLIQSAERERKESKEGLPLSVCIKYSTFSSSLQLWVASERCRREGEENFTLERRNYSSTLKKKLSLLLCFLAKWRCGTPGRHWQLVPEMCAV